MPTYVHDCPRCGTRKVTFDILADIKVGAEGWRSIFEVFCKCRHCLFPSIFQVRLLASNYENVFKQSGSLQGHNADLTPLFMFERYIDISVTNARPAPDNVPDQINNAFLEGTRCLAVGCHNAAGAMFRLCLDLATKSLLPPLESTGGPSKHERRNLAPRLEWLFANGLLPQDLIGLSKAVKDNGDDGAHEGSLNEEEAEDIYDFAFELLDRLFTQPARIEAAQQRRAARRQQD